VFASFVEVVARGNNKQEKKKEELQRVDAAQEIKRKNKEMKKEGRKEGRKEKEKEVVVG
jgi:hypothetical protein